MCLISPFFLLANLPFDRFAHDWEKLPASVFITYWIVRRSLADLQLPCFNPNVCSLDLALNIPNIQHGSSQCVPHFFFKMRSWASEDLDRKVGRDSWVERHSKRLILNPGLCIELQPYSNTSTEIKHVVVYSCLFDQNKTLRDSRQVGGNLVDANT